MTAIRATVFNGRIEPEQPIDLPNGTRLQVIYTPIPERIGIDEAEWSDDEPSLADWGDWLSTIEPVEFIEGDSFEEQFRSLPLLSRSAIAP